MRLFNILTEDKFRIHQSKCVRNWDSNKNDIVDKDQEGEGEGDGECLDIDCKSYLILFL